MNAMRRNDFCFQCTVLTVLLDDPPNETNRALIVRFGSLHLDFCQVERMPVGMT